IMSNVDTAVPGTTFGVAEYKDYPGVDWPGYGTVGGSGDYPWLLTQDLTSDTTAVQNGINPLFASGGADEPESMTRAMYESQFVAWRPGALHIIVLFTDARAHDTGFNGQDTGGDPGRDGLALTADDLDFEDVVAQMASAGVQEIGVSVGAGGGSPYLQYAAAQTGGAFANLGGDFVTQVTNLILGLAPQASDAGQAVGLRAEAGTPANPFLQLAPVRSAGAASFDLTEQLVFQNLPQLQGFVSGMNDGTRGTRGPADVRVVSNSTVAEVSLLNGLVYARGLHAVATSRTTALGSDAGFAGTSFDDIRVNGVDLSQPIAPNTVIPLAGVGTLILNEVKTSGAPGQSSEVLVHGLHLVLDTAQLRGELFLGRAYAGTSCAPKLGEVLRTFDNDAGIGGDAPGDPASAVLLTSPSLVQGRLVGSDRVDAYRIHASIGEKVSAAMVPSIRAAVDAHHVPTLPGVGAGLPLFSFTLRQPGDFAPRIVSAASSLPARVELNVDITGDWVLEVANGGAVDGNYTLGAAVSPILLNAQNDASLGGDAPDACGTQDPVLANGAFTGVLRDGDYDDWFTVRAKIGDAVSIVLKPAEDADGADFDLAAWDTDCSVLLAQSVNGKGIIPKGTPDEVSVLPADATRDYRVHVQRINGIGNWYLTVLVEDPMPTLGTIDVETMGDAGSDAGTANPLTAPAIVQGRLPDGDAQDWFRFNVANGDKRIVVALDPQLLSSFSLTLLRPDGSVAATQTEPLGVPASAVVNVDQVGVWNIRVAKVTGGG
ncbi:MAG: hypothetical protein LC624_12405, partial [Halobacteriales archaeon]|nr:hypothetical protein [Halobacteriales archaeon]